MFNMLMFVDELVDVVGIVSVFYEVGVDVVFV